MCIGIRAEFVVYASNTVVIITDFLENSYFQNNLREQLTFFCKT